MRVPAPVQPDHRKVEPVVGAHDSRITLRRISDRQSRCTYCQCIQKLTSCNHFLSFLRMVVEALTAPQHFYRLISFGKNQQASIFVGSPRWAQYTSAKPINCTRGTSHSRLGQSIPVRTLEIAPASCNSFFIPAQLCRVDSSGVPPPRQWVSRLTA